MAIGRFWFCGSPFGKSSRAIFQVDGEFPEKKFRALNT